MKRTSKLTLVVSKVLEILHWIAAISMVALLVCSLAAKGWLESIFSRHMAELGTSLSTYGLELTIVDETGGIQMTAILLFSIGSILILSLMAMVFRNLYLIIKTATGNTWFSKGNTPFQKDNIRMVKEIGIFCISIPVVGLIISIIARFVIGIDAVETAVHFDGIVMGIAALCLTQVFVYGTELQQDVDGLL